MQASCLLPPYFAHPSFVPKNPVFNEKLVINKEKQVYPSSTCPFSLFLSLFPSSITPPPQPNQFHFCTASNSILPSWRLIIITFFSPPVLPSICPSPIFDSFSISSFLCSFFVLCQVLVQGTSCDPCSPSSSPLCQVFFMGEEEGGEEEEWQKRESRQINKR